MTINKNKIYILTFSGLIIITYLLCMFAIGMLFGILNIIK